MTDRGTAYSLHSQLTAPRPARRPQPGRSGTMGRMADVWLYCPELSGDRILLSPDEAHHALRVRRVREGEPVTAFDGCGQIATGPLRADRSTRKTRAAWVEVHQRTHQPPPAPGVFLIVATPRPSRLDWMVEKCTELGAEALILCDFARSTPRPAAANRERLRRIAIEACKQARRAWLPRLGQAADPVSALAELRPRRTFVADPRAGTRPLAAALGAVDSSGPVAVVVGPEGGLTDDELCALQEAGAEPVTLAPYVLRVETAAVAAVAQALYAGPG